MKIGFLEYYATGEGVTFSIDTGISKEDILNKKDEYWHSAIDFYEAEDLKEYILSERRDDAELNKFISVMKEHTPYLLNKIKESFFISLNYEAHFNLN